MVLVLVAALALLAVSVTLIGRAFAAPGVRRAETLGRIGSYGFAARRGKEAPGSPVRSALDSVAGMVGGLFARRLGGIREAELRNQLMAAGLYGLAPKKFMGYRILSAFSVPAAWIWFAPAAGVSGVVVLLGAPFALLVGWAAPLTIVRSRAERRLARIDYELPELIDLLVVTVEAGLGFTGSLQVAAERLEGPLGAELRLALQEQSMGLSTNEALRNMLARADTPMVRSFVRSILQGETLGVSIGQIMRNLATDMRKRRRQAAEERAQKAPIKILFPLVFLIFPAMFVVLLAPAIFSFLEAFSGS